jgi:hypothetical protein
MKTKAFLLLSCIISLSASHARGTPKVGAEEKSAGGSAFEEVATASATPEHKGYSLKQTHYAVIHFGERTLTLPVDVKDRLVVFKDPILSVLQPKMTVDQKMYLVSGDDVILMNDAQTVEEMLIAHFGDTPVSGTYTLRIQ